MTGPAAIFLHLPKTGGSTLHRIMNRQYPREAIYTIGLPIPERLEVFKALPEHERARIRLLRGHMEFGLHRHLPGPAVYVTILRQPLDRSLSHFARARSHHRTEGMDLVPFLESGRRIDLDNGQTRWLSGRAFVPYGEVTERMLEDAKRNLAEGIAVAGLQERFDESLMLIADALGWRATLLQRRANVTPGKRRVDELTAPERAALEAHNRHDTELYRFARDLFAERAVREGPSLQRRVRAYRRKNRLVQALTGRLPGAARGGG